MKHISTFKIFESLSSKTSGLWYHGDWSLLKDFKDRKMDVEDYKSDRNAIGPGIYFSRDESQARGYANGESGHLYTCEIDIKPSRLLHDNSRVDRARLLKFIKMAPDKEGLYNYGQTIPSAISNALRLNAEGSTNMHDAVMGVYNDLFQKDSRMFGRCMVAIGYDAMLHKLPEVDHLIVWNVDLIKILKVEKIQ